MKEWITGRNPVYEVLKAGRRQVFRLLVAQGVEEKGRLMEIISLAARRKAVVERVPRQQLDSLQAERKVTRVWRWKSAVFHKAFYPISWKLVEPVTNRCLSLCWT
jgi:tRNA G18 (ribose-2'-O)-methylase SpoU